MDPRSTSLPRPRARRSPFGLAAALVAGGLALLAAGPLGMERAAVAKDAFEYGCRVQPPQRMLERRAFVKGGVVIGDRQRKALRYLAERYGNAGDELTAGWNPEPAADKVKTVRFFGLPVSVHERVAPVLSCVEKRIRKTCRGKSRYTPKAVGGLRTSNTYRGPELSNHLFGIAIDIDPDRNPCCGCVDPWPTSPLCKLETRDPFARAALPKCWVRAFERYGFDWLGHDPLEDTMHFEFLGDPDRIGRDRPRRRAKDVAKR